MQVVNDETATRGDHDDAFQCAPVEEKPSAETARPEPKTEAEEHTLEESGYGYGV